MGQKENLMARISELGYDELNELSYDDLQQLKAHWKKTFDTSLQRIKDKQNKAKEKHNAPIQAEISELEKRLK